MVDLLCLVCVFDAAFTAVVFPVVLAVVYESAEPAPHKECTDKPHNDNQ
jgi:hypothetical protein